MSHTEGAIASASTDSSSEGKNTLNYVNFNQDYSSICVGADNYYQIIDFDSNNRDELKKQCTNQAKNCVLVARLFTSSLVAYVSEGSPRQLSVNHFKKNSHICSYTYVSSVRKILLNRERLVIVHEDKLSIHIVKDMELIHTITDTPTNELGVAALANSNDNCFLAFPGTQQSGVVQIFDAYNLKSVIRIDAHESPLQCISFNHSGTMLATASVKGTVIRVFSVSHEGGGEKLFEFRRGMSRSVTIYSLNFSADNKFLLASSNTETIHCFKLENPPQPAAPPSSSAAPGSYVDSMYSMFSGAVTASKSYLPQSVTGIMTQDRAFAWANLPSHGSVTKVCLTTIYKVPRVVVVNAEGMVYIYEFNPTTGGEMNLLRQHRLNGETDDPGFKDILSYSGVLKDSSSSHLSEAEKEIEIKKAAEPPSLSTLNLEDSTEFPPV